MKSRIQRTMFKVSEKHDVILLGCMLATPLLDMVGISRHRSLINMYLPTYFLTEPSDRCPAMDAPNELRGFTMRRSGIAISDLSRLLKLRVQGVKLGIPSCNSKLQRDCRQCGRCTGQSARLPSPFHPILSLPRFQPVGRPRDRQRCSS